MFFTSIMHRLICTIYIYIYTYHPRCYYCVDVIRKELFACNAIVIVSQMQHPTGFYF